MIDEKASMEMKLGEMSEQLVKKFEELERMRHDIDRKV